MGLELAKLAGQDGQHFHCAIHEHLASDTAESLEKVR
jgi:hypothetical protein